jgi:hypothetical protein
MSTLSISVATVLAAAIAAGCGDNTAPRTHGRQTETSASTGLGGGPTGTPNASNSRSKPESSDMKIRITIGGQRFSADLRETAAARDLVAQLPVTVNMLDHGGVEKTGPLPAGLSLDGQPDGADPDIGDVGYYAPNGNFVLYYGDQSYLPGIVLLGKMEAGVVRQLAATGGSVTVTVEAG